jgi:hypothetical protein
MALVCSIDFKTSPINPSLHDLDFMGGRSNTTSLDSFHFEQGRVTPDLPMFTPSSSSSFETYDLEPVPIGAIKTPYHQAHLQSMLKESVELLFGSSSCQEDDCSVKKRKRSDSDLSDDDCSRESRSDVLRFRPYQNQQWGERFEDLKEFKRANGHCSVPYDHPPNPSLARWVKRQRYQYKLYIEGEPSAMTDERLQALEAVGFVWDTYTAAWERRLSELRTFQAQHGHTNVPATYRANKKLAAWVKCQRRQYKLFSEGKDSTLTLDRVEDLNRMGFQWGMRGNKQNALFSLQ